MKTTAGDGPRKKHLYEQNGYTIFSDQNPTGRLIVTYDDGLEQGFDAKKIDGILRQLFAI